MTTTKAGYVWKAVLPVLCVVAGACEPSTSKVIVVLADVSKTVPMADMSTYTQSFAALIEELKPGDRLVVGRISGQAVRDFSFDFDVTLPHTGVYIDDVEARDSLLMLADSAFTTVLQNRDAMQSDVLAALAVAGEVFSRSADAERWLIVLSDMRHESPELNLSRQGMDSAFTSSFIRREQEAGTIPDLSNVRVRVVGAGASNRGTDSYIALRSFWLSYFREAGALIDTSDYGRTAVVALRQ